MAAILLYHRIAVTARDPWALNVSPEHFAEHLAVLARDCDVVMLDELVDGASRGQLRRRQVAITFDDGYASDLQEAAPRLRAAGVPATFFVPTAHVGASDEPWWDALERILFETPTLPALLRIEIAGRQEAWDIEAREQEAPDRWLAWDPPLTDRHRLYAELWSRCRPLATAERELVLAALTDWSGASRQPRQTHRLLSHQELFALAGFPGVQIGAHTHTHPRLADLPPQEQDAELRDGRTRLETMVGREVNTFAYPYGKRIDYTDNTRRLVEDAGFRAACINEPGLVHAHVDPLELPRLFVRDLDGRAFANWLAEWIDG